MIPLPRQEALPELRQDEQLGRSIVANRAAKKARTKGVIIRDVFLEAEHAPSLSVDLWVANYYSARNPLRLSSLVILGVVARMFRCATRSSCWCT